MIHIDGIRVSGSPDFIDKTRQALVLLQRSATFQQVRPFLTSIREGRRSGLLGNRGKPMFRVGQRTWQSSVIWYSSSIVHDAGHAKLFMENRRRFLWLQYIPDEAWTGKEAERYCLRLQLAALRELGADEQSQNYVEKLIANPTYQLERVRSW